MPSSRAREGAKKDETVSISLAYLAFLHDELAVNKAKLKEILGPGAEVISKSSADSLARTEDSKSTHARADKLANKLREWGMDVSQERKGDMVQFVVGCPYAAYVHPRITAEDPVCPLSEYVLGEVRQLDAGAALVSNALTGSGSRFLIRLGPE
jgi:hypothetical protein